MRISRAFAGYITSERLLYTLK